jgi:hypothetical protein
LKLDSKYLSDALSLVKIAPEKAALRRYSCIDYTLK